MTRLDAVCAAIVPAEVIADVGCDHGRVAKYVLQHLPVKKVIASDISVKCLDKAKTGISDERASFMVCDGICYICDEAVIAGMGGLLISDIIRRAEHKPNTLVLCPHRDADAVRRTLISSGYTIELDIMCRDRGRFYTVMRAGLHDEKQELNELQIMFGINVEKRDDVLRDYLIKLKNTYSVAPLQNGERLRLIEAALEFQGI